MSDNAFVNNAHVALVGLESLIQGIEDAADVADMAYPAEVYLPRVEVLNAIDEARLALNSQQQIIDRLNAKLAVRAEVEQAIASEDARKLLAQFIYELTRQITETLEAVETDFRKVGARVVWGARGRDIMPQTAALMTVAELLAKDTPDFHDEARALAKQRIGAIADQYVAQASKRITDEIVRAARSAAAKWGDGE